MIQWFSNSMIQMHYWHYSIGNLKHEGNLSWKKSSHERGYISHCLMPSYILNDQYNWFSRTYFSILHLFIMKYVVIYIVIHIITLNQYATQFLISNMIFNIMCNMCNISRIPSQWCIEYYQKLQTDFLCAKLSFSDSAIYYMAWIL